MARKYNGGMEVGTGFDVQSNRPLDERDIVQTQIDLLVLENCYPGIEVKVEDESYVAYKWNGVDQTNIANWTIQTSGGGGTGDGDMLKSDYAFDNNTVKDSNQLNGQDASSYMTKSVYDPDGNNIVQNSEQLGGQNPAYYDQGAELTSHVNNDQVHLSTDERAAIDNSPNVPNAGNTFATQADLAAGGNGDMLISVYGGSDTNTVRNSDTVDGLTGAEVDQRAHVADVTTNPHAVTKANVNLGNADNTTDLNKPISTDTQTALDNKAGLADNNTFTGTNQFDDLVGTLGGQYVKGVTSFYDNTDTFRGDIQVSNVEMEIGGFNDLDLTAGQLLKSTSQTSQDIIDDSTGKAIAVKEYVASSHVVNEPSGSSGGINIVKISQADYDLGTPNANTFYIIE